MDIGGKFKKWTPEEAARAAEIFRTGKFSRRSDAVDAISTTIGRSYGAVSCMLSDRGPTFAGPRTRSGYRQKGGDLLTHKVESKGPSEEVIAERDYRVNLEHDSISAMLLGDPKPGYSALDRKRTVVSFPK